MTCSPSTLTGMHVCTKLRSTCPHDGAYHRGTDHLLRAMPEWTLSSETGTSMFMSAKRALPATRSLASWHTFAIARSRGRVRDASAPEVAHAAPLADARSDQQRHRRSRHSSLGTAWSCGSCSARDAASRHVRRCRKSQPAPATAPPGGCQAWRMSTSMRGAVKAQAAGVGSRAPRDGHNRPAGPTRQPANTTRRPLRLPITTSEPPGDC